MTTPDDSGTHATLADSGETANSQELPRGSNLGRYVIIEPIGSGGMGTVYRAYDPQLNRGVALKILSVKQADVQAAERAKARLIREAQALAQLSHPNVVAVHDAGTFEDDVFIAMELVEGKTLGDWLKEEKRSVKEILEVMIAAGRGLSAAHKAGLIHRDFKPGNVMVGEDGRVRVLDFGLARAVDQEGTIEDGPKVSESNVRSQESKDSFNWKEISSDSSPNLLQSPLTHAGGVLGTPLYMAPEQHLGLKTDARTDQFGFCVVLYEALYGKRPFLAVTLEKLKSEVIRQQVCVPRTDTDVPDWLWQIVYKGLSVKPEDRYATIDSLLIELEKDPEEARRQKRFARRRGFLLISLVLLTVTLPIGVWYGIRYRTFQLCKNSEGEFDGIWDDATRTSVRTAFLDTEKPFAQGTWERVEGTVDLYISQWNQMRSDICEAKLLRGTLSEELFDLRMSCLRERIIELEALVRVFRKADAEVVQNAVKAISSNIEIAFCADEEAIRAPYPPPKTAEDERNVAVIRKKLADVEALGKTGKYTEGLDLAQKLEEKANAANYRPVQAEILYQLGELLSSAGEYKRAESTLYEAARFAAKSADRRLAAKSMTSLVFVIGYAQGRPEDGLLIGRDAEIFLEFGGDDDVTRARLLNNLGVALWNKGIYDKALVYYQKALSIRKNILGPEHPDVAITLNSLGANFYSTGDYDKSLEYHRKSLAIREKAFGSDHPDVASSLNNLGGALRKKGEYDRALESYRKSLAIHEKALGSEHLFVAINYDNMGNVFWSKGDYDKALECFRKALKIREKALGSENPRLIYSLNGIGNVLVVLRRHYDALGPLGRIVNICEKKTCDPGSYGGALLNLARALEATDGDKELSNRLIRQAREIFGKTPKRFKKELEEINTWLEKNSAGRLAKKANK